MLEISDKAARSLCGESQRITPEIPLEGDYRERTHARPDHAQSRLSSCKTRVEEAQTWYHDHHHGRSHNDVSLVTSSIPLI